MKIKLYDAAGPTMTSFVGETTVPDLDSVSSTRIVETSTFVNGRFEGDTLRTEFIGRFDLARERAKADTMRILVDGERHYQIDFDRPLDLYQFGAAYSSAFKGGVEFTGNRHANLFIGEGGNDRFSGGGGDDRLLGDFGDNVLRGGGGADRLICQEGRDRLVGGSGDDRLSAGYGDDVLRGDGGADRLDGGWGEDRLVGGPGDDRLVGGDDVDELTGGGGADVFVIQLEVFGCDQVSDFRPGRDLIDLSGIDARADRQGDQSFRFIGEEEFSGRTGELRFDGQNLVGMVYVNSGTSIILEMTGVETLREDDLLL